MAFATQYIGKPLAAYEDGDGRTLGLPDGFELQLDGAEEMPSGYAALSAVNFGDGEVDRVLILSREQVTDLREALEAFEAAHPVPES